MVRKSVVGFGVAGGVIAAIGIWNRYQRYTTESVPYTTVARVGDVELRRYPPALLAETVAPTEREAFGRLFRYLTGANDATMELSMTAPVEVSGPATTAVAPTTESTMGSLRLPITAPVERGDRRDDGIRMAFYLPDDCDVETAPRPTDATVELVVVPERTLAVRRFSWRPTERRLTRETRHLVTTLDRSAIDHTGEPFFLGYDAPWTLPFLRRNEVAVAVDAPTDN